MADNAGAQPPLAVTAARAHRCGTVDEFDLADRFYLGRAIGPVHRTTLDKDAVRNVVTAAGVGEQLGLEDSDARRGPRDDGVDRRPRAPVPKFLLCAAPPSRDHRSAIRGANFQRWRQRARRCFGRVPGIAEALPHPASPPLRPAWCDVKPNLGEPSSQPSLFLPSFLVEPAFFVAGRQRPLYSSITEPAFGLALVRYAPVPNGITLDLCARRSRTSPGRSSWSGSIRRCHPQWLPKRRHARECNAAPRLDVWPRSADRYCAGGATGTSPARFPRLLGTAC